MSLGYLPLLAAMLLESYGVAVAVLGGLLISVLLVLLNVKRWVREFPNFILTISVGILVLVGISCLLPWTSVPKGYLPLTLELSLLMATMPIYLHHRRFLIYCIRRSKIQVHRMFAQSAEAAVVSVRILLMTGLLHLLVVTACALWRHPFPDFVFHFLFNLLPPTVLAFTIFLNQVGIVYFNYLMRHAEYVPVVNRHGVVTRLKPLSAVSKLNSVDIVPMVRIAVSVRGHLFLCSRDGRDGLEKSLADVPLESYLYFGESLDECCRRILSTRFKHVGGLSPIYIVRHNSGTCRLNRQVYLYLLELDDEAILAHHLFCDGKLWCFEQIEQNLHCGYFSSLFEEEYDYLKDIIDIREKYKES